MFMILTQTSTSLFGELSPEGLDIWTPDVFGVCYGIAYLLIIVCGLVFNQK